MAFYLRGYGTTVLQNTLFWSISFPSNSLELKVTVTVASEHINNRFDWPHGLLGYTEWKLKLWYCYRENCKGLAEFILWCNSTTMSHTTIPLTISLTTNYVPEQLSLSLIVQRRSLILQPLGKPSTPHACLHGKNLCHFCLMTFGTQIFDRGLVIGGARGAPAPTEIWLLKATIDL